MFYIVPVFYTCLGVFCRYLSTVCIDLAFSQLFRSAIHPHWFLQLFWVVFYHLWSLFLYCNIFSLVIRRKINTCVVDVVNTPCRVVPNVMTLVLW